MGCAVNGCQEGDELKTDPCTVCGKQVHHICAIGVFEGKDSALNERFCSSECVARVYRQSDINLDPAPATSKRPAGNIWAGSDSDFAPSPDSSVGETRASSQRVTKRLKVGKQSKLTYGVAAAKGKTKVKSVATPASLYFPELPPPSPVSELGVPLSVRHARKAGTSDSVWDLIHHLDEPYRKRNPWLPSGKPYHNLCLLCCESIKARAKTTRYSWEEALRNTKHASNAKDHIKSMHEDHPLAILAEQKVTEKAKHDVENAEAEARSVLDLTKGSVADTTISNTTTSPGRKADSSITTSKSTKRFFRPNEKMVNVLISKWLVNQGLPYTVCSSDSFLDVIRAATGDPEFPILSRDRHGRLLNGQFQLFCDLVGELLSSEFQKACSIKFLNLIHDIWTSCGKESIVGASVAFIDSKWRFRYIAMLATVKNDGHNAPLVAKLIENGFKVKYGVDIRSMTRYTMSDTTPSAKNVADNLGTEQEDCSMHLLSRCIGYGLGMKDNIQTTSVWDSKSDSWEKVVTTVTPGGAFDEGGTVIQKLRNLNNYFRSSKQLTGLTMIQKALSYPELSPLIDNDVRVAYTCKLIRRSIVNYAAFQAYFQSNKDTANVWSVITAQEWMLAAEMEAATNSIANLALVEAQSENLVASFMVVFRRLAENKLKSFKFQMMGIEAPRSKEENETTHRRVLRTRDQFSEEGKICLRRTLLQLQARFPKVTRESIASILLDPRTKAAVKKIAAVGNVARKEEKALYTGAMDFLKDEHRHIFRTMAKQKRISLGQDVGSQGSSIWSQETSPFSSPASTGWDDEDELLVGAPIRSSQARDEVAEDEVNIRADKVLAEWLELEPDWLEIATRQNPTKTKDELNKDLYIGKPKGLYWSMLGLYKHVDVLEWLREEGEERFPSIAPLARIHLGKVSSSAFQERVFSSGGIVMGATSH